MSGILNSGKIKTLLDRLTAARAAYLDAAISSRAPSSTALSTATWTGTKAGYLDQAVSDCAPASTALDNTTWTDARAGYLDGIPRPPTTSGLKGISDTVGPINSSSNRWFGIADDATASTSTYDSWTTLLSESSASGVLQLMAIYQAANASNLDAQFRLSIDGNVVYTSAAALWSASSQNNDGVCVIGAASFDSADTSLQVAAMDAIPFTDSFTLEFKKTENSAGTVQMGCRYRYYLT